MAACEIPDGNLGQIDAHAQLDCIIEHVSMERTAHDGMAERLRELYLMLDNNGEKRLDENQVSWRTRTDGTCPPKTGFSADILRSTECETKRFTERSKFLDEIIAGCRAGSCPIDKL